jgi:hypothetical protein
MTLDEAKFEMLNPPVEDPGPTWAQRHALLLTAGAAAAGFIVSNPRRVRGLARAAAATPMARRAVKGLLEGLLMGMIARRNPSYT